MKRSCYVHSKKHLVSGWINEVRCKWMSVELIFQGERFTGEMKKTLVIKQQRPQLAIRAEGRYFALSERNGVHLCTCRWTAKQLKEARAEAEILAKSFH